MFNKVINHFRSKKKMEEEIKTLKSRLNQYYGIQSVVPIKTMFQDIVTIRANVLVHPDYPKNGFEVYDELANQIGLEIMKYVKIHSETMHDMRGYSKKYITVKIIKEEPEYEDYVQRNQI